MATVKPWAQPVCRVLSISFQGSPFYQSLRSQRERTWERVECAREYGKRGSRSLSCVWSARENDENGAECLHVLRRS